MEQVKRIYLGTTDFIDVVFYYPEEAEAFKLGTPYKIYKFDGIIGIGKVLQLEKGFLAEFYNKAAIKVDSLANLEKLRKVIFRRLYFINKQY